MDLQVALDTVWVLVAGMLVFFMNLGFGLVESGFARAKNAVNIMSKNFVVFSVASIAFLAIGWGLMFGDGNPFMGLEGLFFLGGADNSPAVGDAYQGVYSAISWTGIPLTAKFFFQLAFAATAATIVSGAVAERIKYVSFIIFSFLLVAFIYPIVGHWIWGGGWLAELGFWDFAGSTVVHSTGAWAALAGVIVLGPRIGKFGKDGKAHAIPGHNMTSAFAGALILWLGWFGFNPGSTMAADPIVHLPHRRHDEHVGGGRRARRDRARVDRARQARPRHDHQRRARRARRHHRRLRFVEHRQRAAHRRHLRRDHRSRRAPPRQGQDRRPGRRHRGARHGWYLGNAGRGPLRPGRHRPRNDRRRPLLRRRLHAARQPAHRCRSRWRGGVRRLAGGVVPHQGHARRSCRARKRSSRVSISASMATVRIPDFGQADTSF